MAAETHGENVFDIIVGTYEEFVVGYSFERTTKQKYSLRQTFTNHSHLGAVRCVAANNRYLASGSTDETIKLFNMQKKAEMGTLMQHDGNITDLKFFGKSHLFSASEDNNICVWSTGSWQCLKTLKGHKGGVVSLSVHPSGKLLLSVSKDKTLRTWNLITGRTAFVTNLSPFPELVSWSPTGTYFVVAINNSLDVYLTAKAAKVHVVDFGKKISCVAFLTDSAVAIGGEGGNVETHNIKKKSVYGMFTAHSGRVKAMQVVDVEGTKMLVTSSSSGEIRVWEINQKKLDAPPSLLAKTNSGCRITCMAVYKPTEVKNEPQEEQEKKGGRGRDEDDDEGEEASAEDEESAAESSDGGESGEDEDSDDQGVAEDVDDEEEGDDDDDEEEEVEDEEESDDEEVEGSVDDADEGEDSESSEEEEVQPKPKRRRLQNGHR
uniref:Putative p21-activated protein n=1 Tax=Ornithodoros turicata TaxID=34597 RepID=A0A2R5L429_9ACAR